MQLTAQHDVAVLYLRAADEPPIDPSLEARCQLVEAVPQRTTQPGRVEQWWRRLSYALGLLHGRPLWVTDCRVAQFRRRVQTLSRTWQPEIVHIEYHVMTQYVSALDRSTAPRILRDYEPGSAAAYERWRLHRGWSRVPHFFDLLAWRRFERTMLGYVQSVIVFTERDRATLAAWATGTPIILIPLTVQIPAEPLHPSGHTPPTLAFIGSFAHPPNLEAAKRLIGSIFPCVQTHRSEVRLEVIGHRPPTELQLLAKQHVTIIGDVPDVTPYLDKAAMVVIPLSSGGGMRVKVLDALAAGKAIVASPRAVEGLNVRHGKEILLAESDEQFCHAIIELLNNAEKRVSLATQARLWAYDNLDCQTSFSAYELLYASLLDGPVEPNLH